jgi:small subunit ribosomal protein S24e
MVAEALGVAIERVYPIRLAGEAGRPNVRGTFYVYEKEEDARRQLPRHIFVRLLPKDDRKKELEKRKKAKAKPAGKTK